MRLAQEMYFKSTVLCIRLLFLGDLGYNPIFDTLLLKKACYPLELHGLQAFVGCIDMCYFGVFVPVECFVSLIILLIFAFEMNS